MTFSIFIPDFRRGFEAAGRPRLPALERMVARAAAPQAQTRAEFLGPIFGLEPQELTPAPFMALADGITPDGAYRLCASFVHLAPDRDQLVLMPGSLLETTADEITALAAAFNGLYGTDGWKLELTGAGRAYLCCPRPLQVGTHEPEAVAGQAVLDYMPAGPDAAPLKRIMNETQMLFHTHAVNIAREAAGRPLINSLWLWGGGVLPQHGASRRTQRIMTDLPLVCGLALWAGCRPEPPAQPPYEQDCLLGLAADDLQALERDWLAPSFDALKSGKLKQSDFYLGGLGMFRLDTAAVRRFWRRSQPLVIP